jgi:hypothetical protein
MSDAGSLAMDAGTGGDMDAGMDIADDPVTEPVGEIAVSGQNPSNAFDLGGFLNNLVQTGREFIEENFIDDDGNFNLSLNDDADLDDEIDDENELEDELEDDSDDEELDEDEAEMDEPEQM